MMKLIVACLTAAVVAGCGGGSPSTTAPAATSPSVTNHLKQAGKEIGAAATLAAQEAKPYVDAGIDKTRQGVNTAAAWVEEKTRATTTAPATTTTAPAAVP